MNQLSSASLPRFLAGLSPDVVHEFRQLGIRRRFPASSALWVEGDPPYDVLLLLSGEVKISVTSIDGREIILDLFQPGTLLGELSAIDGGPRSATVTTLSPVEVLAIAADAFNDFLDRHPKALRLLLVDIIGRLRTRVRHQLEFGTGDALGRVCARLTEMADRQGSPRGSGVLIHSPLSQSELASWTGLSREAVVKALHTLRRLGWLQTEGREALILDPERVRRRASQ
jgi:CRP/FNR family cyclic AMP-dependent transcriptional regulator